MGEMSRREITFFMCETAGSDPDSHVSASFWEKRIFFVPDPHHFGKQERNEAKHFWALKPKKTLFLLLFALNFFRFASPEDSFASKRNKRQKIAKRHITFYVSFPKSFLHHFASHFSFFLISLHFALISLQIFSVSLRCKTSEISPFCFEAKRFSLWFLLLCYASEPKNVRRLPKLDPTPDPDLHHSEKLDLDPHQGDLRIRNTVWEYT